MGPLKKSGAMNRKIKKRKIEDNVELSKQMKLFLAKHVRDNNCSIISSSITSPCTSKTELCTDLSAINSLDPEDHIDIPINLENDLSKQISTNQDDDSDFINALASSSSDITKIALFSDQPQLNILEWNDLVNIDNNLKNIVQKQFHFNDPSSWPYITDKIRTLLIEHGPDHGKNSDFSYSENFEQRTFSADWFFKTLPNGDKIERNWLIMLFPSQKMSKAFITDPKKGFSDWRKLSPKILDHENTFEHKSNVFSWKSFEKRLREGKTIDKELQTKILNEKERWKQILKIILDCVRFCCVNNLALKGSSNDINKSNCGIF
ncbi:uncharacterized protein LOC126552552 [Aphis gossypii]|uniref:uncharacterized protein LOC126552552 n=1 Tax=Aphis gossypii TaxID=80765 RepID=UPI002158FEF5|nr:uncharacterized protein LOC126552552 [Aphis gossypii]